MRTHLAQITLLAFAVAVLATTPALPQDAPLPEKILREAEAAYKALDTYKAEGTVVSDIEVNGRKTATETTFSILLKKPNLYLITWTANMGMPGMGQTGAVWSDGTQPYLSMGLGTAAGGKSYSKMQRDDMALASATGISDGAAFTVPSLFLAAFKNQPSLSSKLKNAKLEADEKVGEEDCYVVSGATAASKKEVYWISKSKHLIVKRMRSLESPEGGRAMPELTDAQIEETIKTMGQEVTEASKKRVKEMMKSAAETAKTANLKGSSTETHTNVSSPELAAKDFQYAPPGATLRDSPFGFGANEPQPPAPSAAGVNPAAVGPAGYVLDRAAFAAQLAAARNDKERLVILAKRWNLVMLAVAFCDVVENMPFHSAMAQRRSGFLVTGGWSHRAAGDLREPVVKPNGGAILVEGDCLADVKIANGSLVYIYGDLGATLEVTGQCEVIVGGSIREGAGIEGDGIVQTFVGGDVAGFIRNRGSSMSWVHGSVTGEIGTGNPSTRLHVMGDFSGTLHPVGEASLLYLDVRGFMPSAVIEKTAAARYTEFNASIGESDQPRGFYPAGGMRVGEGSWAIHRRRVAGEPKI